MKDKKEVFKQFKQEKVFAKFCLNVAAAFDTSPKPRDSKNDYLNIVLDEYTNINNYIHSLKKWIIPTDIKIMQ